MSKRRQKRSLSAIAISAFIVILVTGSLAYLAIFQREPPSTGDLSFHVQGLWGGNLVWLGWLDQNNNYRMGYSTPSECFYQGDTVKGSDWRFTLTQTYGHPCKGWKMEMEMTWQRTGLKIGTFDINGGAISKGQTVGVCLRFGDGIPLETDDSIRYKYNFYLYGDAVGWEPSGTGIGTLCVSASLPNPNVDYFDASETLVRDGDSVTAYFTVSNNGRMQGNLQIILWANPNDYETYSTNGVVLMEKRNILLGVGESYSDSKTFMVSEEHVSWDNVLRLSLYCTIKGIETMETKEIAYAAENNPPAAPMISGDMLLTVGAIGRWAASSTDSDGNPVRYTWTVDGVQMRTSGYLESGKTDSFSHSFSAAGQHKISVVAEDSKNMLSQPSSTVVQVVSDAQTQPPEGEEPQQTYTVEVSVMDASTFAPVKQASVRCGAETKETDNLGLVPFSVSPRTITIEASKAGYSVATKTVTVATADMVVNILMVSLQNETTVPEPEEPETPGFEALLLFVAVAASVAIFNSSKRFKRKR